MTASPAVVRAVPEEQLERGSPSLLLAPAYRDVSLLHTRAYDIDGKRYSIKCFTRSPSDILDINFSRSRSPFASAYRRRATTEYDVYEEFKLHKRVSAHPNVVTAHRMLEEANNLFLVLDHSPDCRFLDLLQEGRNLKGSVLIKKAFLQLLDAVEHCHSLGVYHRNLRPDAIECFDDGQRLAITDFGIATTDKMSEERFVGGGRYMAPECREDGGIPVGALPGPYAPSSCDVWSLGIVLLNLITGRNPWNSSTSEDPEFRLYRTTPPLFFAALPTSSAVNMLLARTLEVDWTQRITISEMRREVTEIKRFYSVRGAFALGIDQDAEWSEGSHLLAGSRPAPNELSDKSSSDSETLSGSVVSPPHSSALTT
ncbi:kinase-like domain-containing protein [Lenzites betulinus]|nr:kinase-like domain-containing protein [Lenzites betulinus]